MKEWLDETCVTDFWVVKLVKRLSRLPEYRTPTTAGECTARQHRVVLYFIIFRFFFSNEKSQQKLPLCIVEQVRAQYPDDATDRAVQAQLDAAAARGGGGEADVDLDLVFGEGIGWQPGLGGGGDGGGGGGGSAAGYPAAMETTD